MVAGILHDIAFSMCHVVCKCILHDHVVYFMAICDVLNHMAYFLKLEENFNLGYLKIRNG